MRGRPSDFAMWWRLQPLTGLLLGIAVIVVGGTLMLWLQLSARPPDQRINVPHQWTCLKRGGYCERTGGFDSHGRAWGTEVARWYTGPPTQRDAAQRAAGPGR